MLTSPHIPIFGSHPPLVNRDKLKATSAGGGGGVVSNPALKLSKAQMALAIKAAQAKDQADQAIKDAKKQAWSSTGSNQGVRRTSSSSTGTNSGAAKLSTVTGGAAQGGRQSTTVSTTGSDSGLNDSTATDDKDDTDDSDSRLDQYQSSIISAQQNGKAFKSQAHQAQGAHQVAAAVSLLLLMCAQALLG